MPTNTKLTTAQNFVRTLDQDNFEAFKKLLAPNCHYEIDGKIYNTNDSIAGLYEKNMKAGRKKFDKLVWGKSRVEQITENEFEVYFSDFLTHQGITHNYKCKQRIFVNEDNLVERIQHVEIRDEKECYLQFLRKIGLLDN